MRGRSALLVTVAAAVIGATALTAAPVARAAGAPQAWAPTATQGLSPAGAARAGTLASGTRLRVALALNVSDIAALRDLVRRQATPGDSDYHRWLTPAEFADRFAPAQDRVDAVTSWLRGQGFSGVQVAANRLLVTATGSAAQAQHAFHTDIGLFHVGGHPLFANTVAAQVPASLGATVGAILGLDDLAQPRLQPQAAPRTCLLPSSLDVVGYPCEYDPRGLATAYDAGTTPLASGTSLAVIAQGDLGGVVSDLRIAEQAAGLSQVPVTIVQTGPASGDTSNAIEFDLDTQAATGLAGNLQRLYLYDSPTLNDSDLSMAFNAWAAQDVAPTASASLGECELTAYLNGSMLADDQAFAEAAAQGQTVFVAAGDNGGFCPLLPANGLPIGLPDVSYPASSPYAVGVGGTTLLTKPDGSYSSELAWAGGGGGLSLLEAQTPWQRSAAPPLAAVCTVQVLLPCGRTLPDVAMDADPQSGLSVIVAGQPVGVGGTSLATPLAAGVWARAESVAGNTLGFGAPLLYALAGTGAFHDVTLGDSVPYPALPGYDLATGLGSFDITRAVAALTGLSPASATAAGAGSLPLGHLLGGPGQTRPGGSAPAATSPATAPTPAPSGGLGVSGLVCGLLQILCGGPAGGGLLPGILSP